MSEKREPRVWFITGASRGLGLALASAALDRGDVVVATARNAEHVRSALPDRGPELIALPLDVTDEAQTSAAVEAAVEATGRIDVLVNNAGRGLLGATEETSAAQVRQLLDTNVEGVVRVTRAVLPVMRSQRHGHVINLSSMSGVSGAAGNAIYAATKFAVEGLSEAWAAELQPFGIHVTVVEPGHFRTGFLSSASTMLAEQRIDDYASSYNSGVLDEFNGKQRNDPARAASAICEIVGSPRPPLRLPLGPEAVERWKSKIAFVNDELAQWGHLSESTAYPADAD